MIAGDIDPAAVEIVQITHNTIASQGCQVPGFHVDHPALGDLPN